MPMLLSRQPHTAWLLHSRTPPHASVTAATHLDIVLCHAPPEQEPLQDGCVAASLRVQDQHLQSFVERNGLAVQQLQVCDAAESGQTLPCTRACS